MSIGMPVSAAVETNRILKEIDKKLGTLVSDVAWLKARALAEAEADGRTARADATQVNKPTE